jgi:hypothetical protein
MAEIRFIADFGVEVIVPVGGATPHVVRQEMLRALRRYGRLGWRAVRVPPRGFRFPLASEPDFDWSLLGGRRGSCVVDGEEREGVWFADRFYTRREFAANPRQKLGPAVKFSRGALATDPPEFVEEGDGGFRYVTLAVFRGDGRAREEFAVPSAVDNETESSHRTAEREASGAGVPPLPPQDDHEALLFFIRFVGPRIEEDATFELDGREERLKQFARDHWSEIRAELPIARAVANAMAAAVRTATSEAA